MGDKNITATCKAEKGGKTNKQSVSMNAGKNGDRLEADWISGPTYAYSGTTFTSKHTGYDEDKSYHTKTATYKY